MDQCQPDKLRIDDYTISEYHNKLGDYRVHEEYLTDDEYSFHVTYNPETLRNVKNVIEMIQDCLNEDTRLNSRQLGKVITKVLNMHAKRLRKGKFKIF